MFLQWFYPPRCILCGKIMKIGDESILCEHCQNTIHWKEGNVCQNVVLVYIQVKNIAIDVKKQILYLKKALLYSLIKQSDRLYFILNFDILKEMPYL